MTVTPAVSHNLVYTQPWRWHVAPVPLHARWYAANGSVIRTSDRALREALQAQQNKKKAELIRSYSHYSYHAPAALLADFAVFGITSRTGVRIPSGLIISKTPVAALPYAVLSSADPSGLTHLDLTQIRQITDPRGLEAWVIPGQLGICIFGIFPSRQTIPGLSPSGPTIPGISGGEIAWGCQPSVARAEQGGAGIGGGGLSYEVLPKTKPTFRIRTGPNSGRTIRAPYGIYIGPG